MNPCSNTTGGPWPRSTTWMRAPVVDVDHVLGAVVGNGEALRRRCPRRWRGSVPPAGAAPPTRRRRRRRARAGGDTAHEPAPVQRSLCRSSSDPPGRRPRVAHAGPDAAEHFVRDGAEHRRPTPCAVSDSAPCSPMSTTSSPTDTSPSGPQSTTIWSIVTIPASGRRRPPTRTVPPDGEVAPGHAVGVPEGDGGHRRPRRRARRAGRTTGARGRRGRARGSPWPAATARDAAPTAPVPSIGRATAASTTGKGRDPVQGDPAPDHVEAGGGVRRWCPAELAACSRGGARPGRGQRGRGPPESSGSGLGEGPVLVLDAVGHREVRPQRGEAKRGLGRHGLRRSSTSSAGSAPTRCMPVSTFTWTSVTTPARVEAAAGGRHAAGASRASA